MAIKNNVIGNLINLMALLIFIAVPTILVLWSLPPRNTILDYYEEVCIKEETTQEYYYVLPDEKNHIVFCDTLEIFKTESYESFIQEDNYLMFWGEPNNTLDYCNFTMKSKSECYIACTVPTAIYYNRTVCKEYSLVRYV